MWGVYACFYNAVNFTNPLTSGPYAVGRAGQRSGILDFTKKAIGDVVDKAADGDSLGNPGMRVELLQLWADIFINVLEGVEEGGSNSGDSGAVLDSVAQILFAGVHQSAIGVIDDHDFLGAQQIV